MTRLTLLGLVGALYAVPASAQTTPTDSTSLPADSAAAATPTYDAVAARALYDEALVLYNDSSYTDALAKFDEALVANPVYPAALFGRSNTLFNLGRLEDARLAYEATIAASQGADDSRVLAAATTTLQRVRDAIAAQQAAEQQAAAIAAQNASIEAQSAAVESAVALINADPLTAESAQQAFDLLETAREAGYDANAVAFYYARALNALDRGAEAIPYAEQALAANTEPDASAYYIQLGIANRQAGNDAAARSAFESAKAGSWASWAEYYLREMGDPVMPGTDG